MTCYLCETGEHPGGTLYHVRPAIGVCQECSVGVCREHGAKAGEGSKSSRSLRVSGRAPAPSSRRETTS